METRNAVTRSSGRAQTIVEVVSGGTVSGIGTRIVPSADGTGRAVTSPSEPTKVSAGFVHSAVTVTCDFVCRLGSLGYAHLDNVICS